jgi:hypothetical protein
MMGLPESGYGAFMPTPYMNPAAASNVHGEIDALMGNVPVGSPRPAAMYDHTHPGVQPSSQAPNYFLPVVYVMRLNRWRLAIQRRFVDLPMPVPAVAPNATTTATNLKARIGGRTATRNARPYVVWPVYGGRK